MEKYYQTLSKEGKTKVKQIYERDYSKSDLDIRLFRLKIYALVSYIFSFIILAYAFTFERNRVGSLIIAITLIVLGTVYFIGSIIIKLNVLNKIAIENK